MTYLFSFVDQTGIKCQHFLQQFGFISEVFTELAGLYISKSTVPAGDLDLDKQSRGTRVDMA